MSAEADGAPGEGYEASVDWIPIWGKHGEKRGGILFVAGDFRENMNKFRSFFDKIRKKTGIF